MATTEEKLDMDLDDIANARKTATKVQEEEEDTPMQEETAAGEEESTKKRGRSDEDGAQVSRRIYVSNLPWSVNWQHLKDYFRQAGNVVYASVMTEDGTGRSKGCGIVEFETVDEALHAINTLNDSELDGRRIGVREDREDKEIRGGGHNGGRGFENKKRVRGHDNTNSERITLGRRVFVGNLAWSTSWQDLKDFFRQVGNVVYSSIMTEDDTGRSKGCGIVEFETPEEALKAIETLHDAELDGRRIIVREDREDKDVRGASGPSRSNWGTTRSRGGGAPPVAQSSSSEVVRVGRRIYVGNLAWSTSWQDLKDYFRQAGNVVYASVMTEDDTGRSKGCGIVEFETSEQAVQAIESLHDSELDGRRITVREDREDKDLKGFSGNDRKRRGPRSRN
eukprot:CAMPEP_0197286296 /NCGR_PEP_ID=MMETSP0890-20130614/1735_1 /TAXON_ID=44058 ORGANISM="Aureoumbra lagunensis, Strain CCMP1510" /NCGR_SAMPLE_ID=MMETSP0890 /ASSEMBLY_ACC=CAM_ASM_000533 /LENGTH=393 /DNA_ID=CAMNT_0042754527 /DNA_START=112 /DNA_END=1293 /DNA_ORIENTATION=+